MPENASAVIRAEVMRLAQLQLIAERMRESAVLGEERVDLERLLRVEMPIPEQAARHSGMMPPTHSEMISPTVPR